MRAAWLTHTPRKEGKKPSCDLRDVHPILLGDGGEASGKMQQLFMSNTIFRCVKVRKCMDVKRQVLKDLKVCQLFSFNTTNYRMSVNILSCSSSWSTFTHTSKYNSCYIVHLKQRQSMKMSWKKIFDLFFKPKVSNVKTCVGFVLTGQQPC